MSEEKGMYGNKNAAKPYSERKTESINFRVRHDQKRLLQDLAAAEGKSLGEWIGGRLPKPEAEKWSPNTGLCALCGPDNSEIKTLCKSHHLPKSVYKYFTKNKAENTSILLKAPERRKPLTLGRQIYQPLLCNDCEQLMSAKGEDYFVSKVLKINTARKTPSPVYYALLKSLIRNYLNLEKCHKNIVFSIGSNLLTTIDSRQIYHFAIGFIWKATLDGWRHCPPLNLDSELAEQMRIFLLGGAFVKGYVIRVVPSFWEEKYAVVFPMRVQKDILFTIQNFDFYLEKSDKHYKSAISMKAVPIFFTADKIRSKAAKDILVKKIQEDSESASKLSWIGSL